MNWIEVHIRNLEIYTFFAKSIDLDFIGILHPELLCNANK